MRRCIQKIITILFYLFFIQPVGAQDISFFHLSKKDGLSDNQIAGVVMDKNGLLWVGTSEGLNCYDGYTVKRFYKEEYPALQNNNILRMTCDEKNRLWIHFADKSITMLDEERQFHAISIMDNGKPVKADFLLPYTSRGVLFLSGSSLYYPNEKDPLIINRLRWEEDTSLNNNFLRINSWDKDKLICSGNNRLALFDVTRLKVLHAMVIPGIRAAARLSDTEALITTETNDKLCKVNLATKKIIKHYARLHDQYGEEMIANPQSIYLLYDQQFIFTSPYAGLYLFDAVKETLVRYKHDPVDPQSISANNTNFLFSDTSGYFFVTSHTAGLNYFNINYYLAKWKPFFRDEKTKKIFDGYVNCIGQSGNGNIWMGTQNSLIEWNRTTNKMHFQQYGIINGSKLEGSEEVRVICIDKRGNKWIGLNRFGVVVLNSSNRVIKYLGKNENQNGLAGNLVNDIKEAPDGSIWIAAMGGLSIVDPVGFTIMKTDTDPVLKRLSGKFCQYIWFRNQREAWVGTKGAAYRINFVNKSWKLFNEENGLKDFDVLCMADDTLGNVYIGTSAGLNIIKGDTIISFHDRTNGLRSNRCDGLLRDNDGKIWIGNNNSLICYEPGTKTFTPFDESAGLSNAGFRPAAFLKTTDGEIFWGSDKGINHFYPNQLRKLNLPLEVLVNNITTTDTSCWLATSKHINLSYFKNGISFSFSAIDLYSSRDILYKYKLEGNDAVWKITPTPLEVQYSKLPSGNYTFRVMASKDGLQWVEAKNSISITITTPWWRSRWFITYLVVLGFAIIGYCTYRRNKKIKQQQEQIETEQAINYFASSIYQQRTVDAILWDVTKNCIGRLQFEDCVIYLKEDEKNVLIQKAAWGPKTTEETLPAGQAGKILNPLEIPVGKGITGFVAQTGEAEIIPDTSKDERYIVDDAQRFSEITVPIVHDGKVLGVIDSEHTRKNFFTQHHLSILTTIASLCANKIVRVRAEQEKQQAQLQLLNHQRKMAEAQLKSLRLQMSPHFLFNSLNSIQQIILSGDDNNATKYLSRFSRLLRLVLLHSDKEKVNLKEELEVLRLYIELESLRFKDSFQYEINCDETIDQEETKIPTLLIQPFIENAIWHGLLHKEGLRILKVQFIEDEKENLVCTIEDNGIGRKPPGDVTSEHRKGKGVSVAEERVQLFNEQQTRSSRVVIEDLVDTEGMPLGTRVKIVLPLLNG